LLDAACGPAVEYEGYTKYKLDLTYVGHDLTLDMLHEGRRRFPNIPLLNGSINMLPFKEAVFDIVLARHILEHLESYENAVKECVRVARKAVIINFFIAPSVRERDYISTRGTPAYNNEYSRTNFENYLSSLRRFKGFELYEGLEKSPPFQTHNVIYLVHLEEPSYS
jgi:ubiquinone/menaquinone biosynthesis C-methylase UbiE